jgi:DNA-directed RNA polymerase subunit M/transcription elongation factor TFIIS
VTKHKKSIIFICTSNNPLETVMETSIYRNSKAQKISKDNPNNKYKDNRFQTPLEAEKKPECFPFGCPKCQ